MLGTDFRLTTKLIKRRNGVLEIRGEGDPDLTLKHLSFLTDKASKTLRTRIENNKTPKIILYEEPISNWWPDTWHENDKLQSYGSPITRLAITSNSSNSSISNPLDRFLNSVKRQFTINHGITPEIEVKLFTPKTAIFSGSRLIAEVKSAPMTSLLSLANSESHNFTAEVLLRNAADSWEPSEFSTKLKKWVVSKNIPSQNFNFVDGSGLSRANRATTIGITSLLWYMDKHEYSRLYKSSMAIIGKRGTLTNFISLSKINGNFYGKTGTLNGVRAISGILHIPNNIRYISIIHNNSNYSDTTISNMLETIYRFSRCP